MKIPVWLDLGLTVAFASMPMSLARGEETERLPFPRPEEIAEDESVVRQSNPQAFDPGLSLATKSSVARELLEDSRDCESPNLRFILLREAKRLAIECGELDRALEIEEDFDRYFKVDHWDRCDETITSVVSRLELRYLLEARAGATLAALERHSWRAFAAKELDPVDVAAKGISQVVARTAAENLLDEPVRTHWSSIAWEITQWSDRWKGARSLLSKDQSAAEGYSELGTCLCVAAGDWDTGLEFLAKGTSAASNAAKAEKAEPTTGILLRTVGDLWLGAAQKEKFRRAKSAWAKRAKERYLEAIDEGLDPPLQTLAEESIRKAESIEAASSNSNRAAPKPPPPPPKRSALLGRNLIENGDCEGVGKGGKVEAWKSVNGEWELAECTTWKIVTEKSGAKFLRPSSKSPLAEIEQIVDLEPGKRDIDLGDVRMTFAADIVGYPMTPGDECQIAVEYLDQRGNRLGELLESARRHARTWTTVSIEGDVPKGTRSIRALLRSHRRSGKNNDGFFDNVSLVLSA